MENRVELQSADFEEDKYSRLRLIPWWDQNRLSNATIMVVGAGAIGNELRKSIQKVRQSHLKNLLLDLKLNKSC